MTSMSHRAPKLKEKSTSNMEPGLLFSVTLVQSITDPRPLLSVGLLESVYLLKVLDMFKRAAERDSYFISVRVHVPSSDSQDFEMHQPSKVQREGNYRHFRFES